MVIESLNAQIAQFQQIGKDHVDSNLQQKTTSFLGRMLSFIGSKDANNQAVKSLIDSVKTHPDFGDKYANMARAQLSSALGSGKPLSGRLAAKVFQDVQIAKNEDLARKSNIEINIKEYFKAHGQEFKTQIDDIIKSKFHEAADTSFTQEEKNKILDDAIKSLITRYTGEKVSPTASQMTDGLKEKAFTTINSKLNAHVSELQSQVTEGLKSRIDGKLEQMGLGNIKVGEDVLFKADKAIDKKLRWEADSLDHMMTREDAEKFRDQIINKMMTAFASVQSSGLKESVKTDICNILAENIEAMPTKDLAESLCQSVTSGVVTKVFDEINGSGPTTDPQKLAHTLFEAFESCAMDGETRRPDMDTAPMNVLRNGVIKLAAQINSPLSPEFSEKLMAFMDRSLETLDAPPPENKQQALESMAMNSKLSLMRTALAENFNVKTEVEARDFMKHNPDIPTGAKGLVKQIFDEIPRHLQEEALEMVREHTTQGTDLPLGTKVIVTPEETLKFSQ